MKNFTKIFSTLVILLTGVVGSVSAAEGDVYYQGTLLNKGLSKYLTYADGKLLAGSEASVWKLIETAESGVVRIQADNGLYVGVPHTSPSQGTSLTEAADAKEFKLDVTEEDGVKSTTLECTDPVEEYSVPGKYLVAQSGGNYACYGEAHEGSNGTGQWILEDSKELDPEEAMMQLTMALETGDATLAKTKGTKEVVGAGLITSVAQLASNAPEVNEGPIENLIDNNCRTFFHSNWSQSLDVDHHDLQVKLPENCEVTQFMARYTGRIGGNNCRPAAMNLYVGHKDEAGEIVWAETPFAQLTEADGLGVGTSQAPTDSVANTGSFWFSTPEACDAIRFEVTKVYSQETDAGNKTPEEMKSFNYSEFQLYPAHIEKPRYEVEAALVATLEEAVNNGHHATPETTPEDMVALAEAINNAIEPVEAAISEIIEDAMTQLTMALEAGNATLAKAKGSKEVIGAALITSADQLASNASDSAEGVGEAHGLQVLIDGDPSTYWHSDWHGVVNDAHDLQVTLPENNELTQFAVKYIGRVGNNTSAPLEMNLYGGRLYDGQIFWEGEPFTQLTEADGLGVDKNLQYNTDVAAHTGWFYFSAPEAYDAIRFEVTRAQNDAGDVDFFNYAEFQMYPALIKDAEFKADEEAVAALEEAVNNGRRATPETPFEEMIELAEAINDAVKAVEETAEIPEVDPNIEILRDLMAQAHELTDGMEGKVGTLGYHVEDEYEELTEALGLMEEMIDQPAEYWPIPSEECVAYLQALIDAYNASDYVYPEAGKTYMIKAQYTDGEYYLTNNNGAGAMTATDPATYDDAADRAAYYWTLGEANEDGAHALYAIGTENSFRFAPASAADGTLVDTNEEVWLISKENTYFENTFTLRSRDFSGGNERNNLYLECSAVKTDRGSNPIAQPHAVYTSDYVFVEVSQEEVDNIVVAISAVETGAAGTTDKYYDLSGRRVLNPANGIFINSNGKKVILK